MTLIELRGIRKTYQLGEIDVPVLHGIDLEIERGEFVALTGSSGSGKSTLMNILGCLDRPTAGSYRLDAEPIEQKSKDELAAIRNRRLGFIFQNFNLLSRTSALDNVLLPMMYAEELGPDLPARAKALLEQVGLGDRLDHYPSQLSGGQQQRVAIARALINNPDILLADEPTGNLDSKTSEEMLRMFEALNSQHKITVLIVTHEPDVARRAARIVSMRDGLIQEDR